MTAPPQVGYVEGETEQDARELMAEHPCTAGHSNGANTTTLRGPVMWTDDEIASKVSGSGHNIAIRGDGSVVRLDGTGTRQHVPERWSEKTEQSESEPDT